jgi:outer membrane lipoprotein-sorting protein
MKRVVCLLLLLVLVGPVMGDTDESAASRSPEAIEILKKVDSAIKAVHSVSYDVATQSSGVAENFASSARGNSILVGWNGNTAERFYSHVETKKADTGETVELTAGGNGDMYFIIDHQTKKAYEDMDPGVVGSGGRALRSVGMIEFVHDAPFDDEIGAEEVELLEDETVDGEPCYQIHVSYGGGQGSSTWFFAKKDFLPRRRVRHFTIPGQGDGSIVIDVTNLETNIEPDESLFVLKLPEGYEQIDDFAP